MPMLHVNARLAAAQRERPADRFEQRLRDDLARRSVGGLEQHGELVAAEPRRGVAGAHRPLDAARDLGEHLVADRMTEGVVDRLEVVEVEEAAPRPAPSRRARAASTRSVKSARFGSP